MPILHDATCGSLESNDVYVAVKPGTGGVELTIESIVKKQYGRQIESVVRSVLERNQVGQVQIFIQDQGAVDFVIRSRVETALKRAGGKQE